MTHYFVTALFVFFNFTNLFGQNNSCVFNDDYESLSIQAAKQLSNTNSVSWSNVDSLAHIVSQNNDMLQLRVGGCYHFGFNLTIKTNQDMINPKDILERIALYLTNKVDFNVYDFFSLSQQQGLMFSEKNENYAVINLDYVTEFHPENLVIHPIVIRRQDLKTVIELSWYYS